MQPGTKNPEGLEDGQAWGFISACEIARREYSKLESPRRKIERAVIGKCGLSVFFLDTSR
jgi:hypothetical protein